MEEEREEIINKGELRGLMEKAAEFHGHYCHKVAWGIRASVLALKELGIESVSEEKGRIVAIVESTGPFCNGIQVATGLTIGDSDLIIRDIGKLALTLLRSDGASVRVVLRAEFLDGFSERNPEFKELLGGRYATISVPEERVTPLTKMQLMEFIMEKMRIKEEEEMEKMKEQMEETLKKVVLRELEIPDEEMFKVEKKKKDLDFSEYAPICQCTHPIVVCESCGETVFEPYIRIKRGKNVCIPCAGERYYMLSKEGIRERC